MIQLLALIGTFITVVGLAYIYEEVRNLIAHVRVLRLRLTRTSEPTTTEGDDESTEDTH